MEDSFEYKSLKFVPLKKLRGKDADFFEMTKHTSDIGITREGWNWEEFYDEAKRVRAGRIDLFWLDGKIVIPATNYLFEYKIKP